MRTQNYDQYKRIATDAAEHGVELTIEQRRELQRRVNNLANEYDPLTLTVEQRRSAGGLTLKRLLHK